MIILETLASLSPADKKIASELFHKMKELQSSAIEAYENGDFELAEEIDAQYEEVSEYLESFLSDIDDYEYDDKEPEDFRDYDENEFYKEFIETYADFLRGSVHSRDIKELAERLRGIAQEYAYYLSGTLDPKISDEQLISLAKEFYEQQVNFRGKLNSPIFKESKKYNKIFEDEEQRKLRATQFEEEHLLPNIYKKFNTTWGRPIPYNGEKFVVIYRGISNKDPNNSIRPGDWVSLNKEYASLHGSGEILSKKVFSDRVVWAGTDENEWFYLGDEDSNLINEITLYHGTIIDNIDSIKKHGLVSDIGEFTRDAYGINDFEDSDYDLDDYGFESLIFATDNKNLRNALTAMSAHIARKLKKTIQDVTINDIRNHGLIIKIKDVDEIENSYTADGSWTYRDKDDENDYGNHPSQVEPEDYYTNSESIPGDSFMHGSKLISFLIKNNLIDSSNLLNRISLKHPSASKEQIIRYIKSLSPEQRNKLKNSY